jgi:hypothetical protein
MSEPKQIVICQACGEQLEYKMYWAKEHREKYPDHKQYRLENVS